MLAAINRLEPQGDTSLGEGILGVAQRHRRPARSPQRRTLSPAADETPIGYYGGTAIVLLTDGENTSGPDPRRRSPTSRPSAGVRIEHDRTRHPGRARCCEVDGFSIATALDEATLQQIAETTGGTYHDAADAASLAKVYDSIQLNWVTRTVPHEITSLVAGLAALLLLAGASSRSCGRAG